MGAYSGDNSTSATLEDQPSSRSFFSRFALPIRSRTRNLADFHIRPAEPHRKYVAGDHVKGAVILTIIKPIRITHLTVALHGFVRVYKNPGAASEPFNPAEVTSDGASRFKYFGNGHASLFQDEQVLSADGRLEPGRYEFNFDLMFPPKGLPSSIDFERGTISYMITATLTRPTSISPTTSCERKVELVEQVDIGPLAAPRPRTIYLEPISKRSKKKRPAAPSEKANSSSTTSEVAEPASDLDSTRAVETSTEGSIAAGDAAEDAHTNPRSPHSDIRSEISGDSVVSGSTGPVGALSTIQGPGGKTPAPEDRTITATIELLKGGCLPGDTIPVRISVQHIKRIKSMHGVIVTLYRQGRVDSAPPPSLFTNLSKEDARRLEKEEYYPRSKTGLGGLSLTSAGSCSVFRKDLSQAFSPLIIDPVTLSASVTTQVRVPEDVFPTIKGVPGEMISFRYKLEVIVDLGGKLANQIQGGQNPRVGAPGGLMMPGRPIYEPGGGGIGAWNGMLITTDPLKREKGVIFDHFEIVVGTSDTSRTKGKGLRPSPSVHTTYLPEINPYDEHEPGWHGEGHEDEAYIPEEQPYHPPPDEYGPPPPEPPQQYPYWNGHEPPSQAPAPFYVPPPEVPDEAELSEKDRIRRAEQQLLPSQPLPPTPPAGPSNPPPDDNIYDADNATPSAPVVPSAPSAPALHDSHALPGPVQPPGADDAPSAPTLEDLSPGPAAHPTDDKQELERQRLMAEASAPPQFPEDYDAGVGSSSGGGAGPSGSSPQQQQQQPDAEPSAPVLTEEDEYGGQYDAYGSIGGPSPHRGPAGPSEPLPRYER
ncbi:pH-response regulator protein palF/RIM8 [Pleurostoma richardsiae]|uniref:PH-response regulator protein palF/RIM8 n=1 Tax=Pleurostoma richardsiae TaxID=41990 RepID=A0AA38RL69_9PEZI|nr:pH-response regulator protein palF/RIM8 [Pleurostoma richardsiae]